MKRVAFVTGSNKGIGLSTVKKLAEFLDDKEWDVYLTSRNEELGQKVVQKLKEEGLTVKYHQLDIDHKASRTRFLEFLKKAHPNGINIAISNAGIAYKNDAKEPFAEQARVTVYTNFTSTLDFIEEFTPQLAKDARVVTVASMVAHMNLKKLSSELYHKMTSPMTMIELRKLIGEFVSHAQKNEHEAHGWPSSSYGISKLGLTKAFYILAEDMKKSHPGVLFNVCCPGYVDTDMTSHKGRKTPEDGADTPFYLATLPAGATEPNYKFVQERKVKEWSKDTEVVW